MMPLAFALAPHSRPDFSGLWRLHLEKSTFPRGPAPKEILVKIEHREPTLIQTMLVVAADGDEQQQTFTYDTTGGESTVATCGGEGQTRAHWNGSELVIESVLNDAVPKIAKASRSTRDYSQRSASIGLTAVARLTGSALAANATIATRSDAPRAVRRYFG